MEPFRRKNNSVKSAIEAKLEAQKIAFAPFSFQASLALRDLGILAEIHNAKKTGITAQAIASKLKISEYGVETLLEVGACLDLVKVSDKKYYLTKTGLYILDDEMTRINMDYVNDVCYQGAYFLTEAIKTSKPAGLKVFGDWQTIYQGLSALPEPAKKSWFNFDHYYSDAAFADALPIVFENSPKKLFDIGGNTGKWAIECLKYDPEVKVTIFDLDIQLEQAKLNLTKHNLISRADFECIDILDPDTKLPGDADVIWMSQFLDCFSKPQIIAILKKLKKAANKNTQIYILEPIWDRQKYEAAKFSLNHISLYFTVLANGNSKMYSYDELKDCIASAGLVLDKTFDNIGENDYTLIRCTGQN